MVTVQQAKRLLANNIISLEPIYLNLEAALGHIIAEDISTPIDLPPFTSSAMDGYAIRISDVNRIDSVKLKISGEVKAGNPNTLAVNEGCAIRIYTGAPIPIGADRVVIQENTQQIRDHVIIKVIPEENENIRWQGEEIKKGKKVINKGILINPGTIGFLSVMGIPKVKVIRKPRVYLIVTGNELVNPGDILEPGQVYDSNSFAISSALKEMGIDDIKLVRKKDNFNAIERVFKKAVIESDMIIFTGGVSVGKYDYVRELVDNVKFETVFYKVEQKPGKPLYFGKYKKKVIFGLPGNPVSSLVCFYEYVYFALRKMMGHSHIYLEEKSLPLLKTIKSKNNKVNFLSGSVSRGSVMLLQNQKSHMMSSFAKANCLIVVPKYRKILKKGENVKVHILPSKI